MDDDRIDENEVLEKLNLLLEKQNHFEEKITELSSELEKIKRSLPTNHVDHNKVLEAPKKIITESVNITAFDTSKIKTPVPPTENNSNPQTEYRSFEARKQAYLISFPEATEKSSNIEKFVGENLINKIGILITIIGVGIGAKYAIDHQLISPLTRILLGYLVGFVLLGIALKLKKDYNSYSSVLMSGAMAIVYFITYAAYSFYSLMPQYMAFGLMVLITVFTVYAALKYDRQVIALIGMIGAYGVPFLLSDGSGNMVILFSYMSIINLGIMVLAFNKYWKPIYYVSFVLSWLIFMTWYFSSYKDTIHFTNAFLFLSVFYLIFYVTYLSYNLIKKELFNTWDVILMLVNSFIFYGLGYALLNAHPNGGQYLGLFTLVTALIQALVCLIIYKMKLAEWHLFYFISTLALTFITIAIPVQFMGNWVTLLWVGEAGLLFWIGRTKQISVYESISYVLMILATMSILKDWNLGYQFGGNTVPVTNIYFVTSLLFVAVFAFINMLNRNEDYQMHLDKTDVPYKIMQIVIPGILLSALFFMFWFEISSYFNQQIVAVGGVVNRLPIDDLNFQHFTDLKQYRIIILLNYSILFFVGLSIFNIRILKSRVLGYINLEANLILIILFLTQGLYSLSELRDSFLQQSSTGIYRPSSLNFNFRYISYLFVFPMLLVCYRYVRQEFIDNKLDKVYSILLHTVILWILSSELITWIDFFKSDQAYKLGLSLLWGGYALLLIALGIWKKQQQLRIGAIVLFSGTLLKLFFYDLQDMGTISRTIVFITLGILLLIISFLYNKYKHIIWNDSIENENSH
jgi:uncharacterized membrane protein